MNKIQNNHFDEAYVKHKDCCVDVNELIKMCSVDREHFFNEYAKDLFCPDCKQAHLNLEFGEKIKCLRTLKNDFHRENCQHSQNVNIANQEQVHEYVKTANPQTIENNLYSLLSRLDTTRMANKIKTMIESRKSTFLFDYTRKNTNTRVCIPQQKIRNGKNEFSYDIAKYYYGDVWLKVGEHSKEHKHNVQLTLYSLQNMEKGSFICSVFISKRSDNLSVMVEEFTNRIVYGPYHIAFFGQMEKSEGKKQYDNLYINDKHNIVLVPNQPLKIINNSPSTPLFQKARKQNPFRGVCYGLTPPTPKGLAFTTLSVYRLAE